MRNNYASYETSYSEHCACYKVEYFSDEAATQPYDVATKLQWTPISGVSVPDYSFVTTTSKYYAITLYIKATSYTGETGVLKFGSYICGSETVATANGATE